MRAPEDTVVPVGIARVSVSSRPPPEVWVRARVSAPLDGGEEGGASPEGAVDLALVGADGRCYAEILGLRLQRLTRATVDPFVDCAYTVAWRRKDLAAERGAGPPHEAPGTWLVFADGHGLGVDVARRLREVGATCFEVGAGAAWAREGDERYVIDPSEPEAYGRLLEEVAKRGAPLRGVVHAWSLDVAPAEHATLETTIADVRQGTLSALRLVQAMVAQRFRDVPRLVFVTRGAQPAGGAGEVASPSQAPLWGLGRTVALEQPDLGCTRIDSSHARHPEEAHAIVRELLSGDGEDQVALRAEGRFVARLERWHPRARRRSSALGGGHVPHHRRPRRARARAGALDGGARGTPPGARRPRRALAAAREALAAMAEAGADVRAMRGDVSRAATSSGCCVGSTRTCRPSAGSCTPPACSRTAWCRG